MREDTEVPKPMPAHLQIIEGDGGTEKYEHILRLGCPYKRTPKNDPTHIGKRDFEDMRIRESLIIRGEELQRHLKQEGVTNYNYQYKGELDLIEFTFSSLFDLNLARIAFMENKSYEVGLTPENPDSSLEEVAMVMSAFQQEFNQRGIADSITLKLDVTNRKIWAIAANPRALVELVGDEYDLIPKSVPAP